MHKKYLILTTVDSADISWNENKGGFIQSVEGQYEKKKGGKMSDYGGRTKDTAKFLPVDPYELDMML
jgi:hypothetical protein